ncbi:hypothetical protein [uncultured Lacinutrix sp.]|uniref:hypothetical protein n=1 Tax=uncultured Lacinutrix sp. TaxID=574032 RepID=UPI00261EBDFF|nr:hypothetical protein [uncultured Lacinutrix sp.]
MKQTEKILGGLIVILMLIRLFFALPYFDITITLLILVLSMMYFGFGFALINNVRLRAIFKKDSYKGISTLIILGGIFTGFILSFLSIYSLFKFQRWPFANQGLLISLYGLLPIIAIMIYKSVSSKNIYYFNSLTRLIIFGVIGTSLYFLSTEKILEMRNRDFPEYVEAEKILMKDPENKELQQKST